jgi:hypothetical protein
MSKTDLAAESKGRLAHNVRRFIYPPESMPDLAIPPTRRQALSQARFGTRVAEEEIEGLKSYFVETNQWAALIAGEVDVIFGSKGAGKSALYSLLVSQRDELRMQRRIVIVPAENPRGTPVFRDLAASPPATEEEFRGMWKLYFLALLASYIRHNNSVTKVSNVAADDVVRFLEENGLLAPDLGLLARLRAVLEYVHKRLPSLEATVTDPHTGLAIKGKITLAEPTIEQRGLGFRSADELLEKLNQAFAELHIKSWLVIDRLDVAFSDTAELEANALRALFRVYLDMASFDQFSLKIFLRDDIWQKLLSAGFREASHVTKSITISWDQQSLINLLVRRLINNPAICSFYGVTESEVLADAHKQLQFFDRVFPKQVDIGARKPRSIDWMLSRTADASKRTAPRELIHLLLATRDAQLRRDELGNPEPPPDNLFDRAAISAALPEVSKARYEQTLCAEHPSLKPFLDKLERSKTQQTPESLARIWHGEVTDTTVGLAKATAEALAEVGFFERKGSPESPAYHVPFLYRGALKLRQGAAT